jgi:hypothetical protein
MKTVAVVLCFAFLLLAVPSLNFAEKTTKFDFKTLLKVPVNLFNSLVPFISSIFTPATKEAYQSGNSFAGKVRPTGDSSIGKPGTGD